MLRLLCEHHRGQLTASVPHKVYARETLQLGVQIVVNGSQNQPAEVLHTLVDHSQVSRVAVEHVREGNSDDGRIHSIRSRAAQVMKTDEHNHV